MSKFSESEISEFRDTFSLFDKSGKEEILYNDVGECMRSLGYKPSNAEIAKLLNCPSQDEMMNKTLTLNEFLPILSQVAGEKRLGFQEFKDGLRLFDKDDSGTLPLYELRTALCSMGERLTEEEAEEILHCQENVDGVVDYEKLIKIVMGSNE